MCANHKIRQRVYFHPAASPVLQIAFAGPKCRFAWYVVKLEDIRGQNFLEFLDLGETYGNLGVDDRVQYYTAAIGGFCDHPRKPFKPLGIPVEHVKENTGVHHNRHLPISAREPHNLVRRHLDGALSRHAPRRSPPNSRMQADPSPGAKQRVFAVPRHEPAFLNAPHAFRTGMGAPRQYKRERDNSGENQAEREDSPLFREEYRETSIIVKKVPPIIDFLGRNKRIKIISLAQFGFLSAQYFGVPPTWNHSRFRSR